MDAAGYAFTQTKSRSDVVYSSNKNNNDDQNTLPKPKVKAKSVLDFKSPPVLSPPPLPSSQQYQQQQYQPSLPPPFQHQYLNNNNNNESYNHYNNNNENYNHYNNNSPQYSINNNNGQINSRFVATNSSPRALSDVTYRPHDTRTELTNRSDPGPYAYNPQQYHYQKQPFNNFSCLPASTTYGNENYFNSNHRQQSSPPPFLNGEAKPHKPKIAANAVLDFDNNNNNDVAQPRTTSSTIVKPRKVTISAQLNKNNNFIDQNYSDSRNDEDDDGYDDDYEDDYNDNVEEEKYGDEDGDDQAELDELTSLSSDPRVQRKVMSIYHHYYFSLL